MHLVKPETAWISIGICRGLCCICNVLRWEPIVCFVDIGWIGDHQFLNFPFIIRFFSFSILYFKYVNIILSCVDGFHVCTELLNVHTFVIFIWCFGIENWIQIKFSVILCWKDRKQSVKFPRVWCEFDVVMIARLWTDVQCHRTFQRRFLYLMEIISGTCREHLSIAIYVCVTYKNRLLIRR